MGTRPLEGPDVDKFLSICCRKEHNTPPVFERVPVGMQMLLTADVSLKGKTVVLVSCASFRSFLHAESVFQST